MGFQQHHPIPTNPLSSKYDLRQNLKPICNDDYRYWLPNSAPVMSQFITVLTTEYIRTLSGNAAERATEYARSALLWIIPSDLLTCLSTSIQLSSKTRPLIIFQLYIQAGFILFYRLLQLFYSVISDYILYTMIDQMQRRKVWSSSIKAVKWCKKFYAVEFISFCKIGNRSSPTVTPTPTIRQRILHDRVQHRNLDFPYRTYGDWWQDWLLQNISETFAQTSQKFFFCSRSQDLSQSATN